MEPEDDVGPDAPTPSPVNNTLGLDALQFHFVNRESEGDLSRVLMEPADENYPRDLLPIATIIEAPIRNYSNAVILSMTCEKAHEPIRIRFNTLNEALLASVNRSFAISVIWRLLRELDGDDVDTVIEGFPLEFNRDIESFTRASRHSDR